MTDELGDTLAILSLRVAAEVDRKLGGRSSDSLVFDQFTKELSKASGVDLTEQAFLQSDPSTTELFAQAIRDTSLEPVQDVSSLSAAVRKIIEPLTRADTVCVEDLGLLKNFCLSLHKSMMAQRLPPLNEGDQSFEDELRFVR